MIMTNMNVYSAMKRSVAAFLRDDRGSISIEAVILFPLYVFLMVGTLTFWDAFKAQGQNAKVAYAVADIMSRHDAVDQTDMAFLAGLQDKMLPATLDQRRMRISSICFADGAHRVLWSFTTNGADAQTPIALEDDQIPFQLMPLMAEQDSVILVELAGRWQPLVNIDGLTDKTWKTDLVIRPRFINIIPHATLNAATDCPTAAGGGAGGGGGGAGGDGESDVPVAGGNPGNGNGQGNGQGQGQGRT